MANQPITMLQIRKVLQLLDQGYSQRRIAREVDISRNTVQDYCVKFLRTGLSSKQLLALTDHDLNQSITEERLIYLKDNRYERLAPRLPDYVKELNRNHHRIHSAVMHFDHLAGDKAEIDFAEKKLRTA
jgi:orotate phosphoribosyltransferase-like protein